MLRNLKRILLTQYIGAIITAYIAAQAVLKVLSLIVYFVSIYASSRGNSVLGGMAPRAGLEWDRVFPELMSIVLYLLVIVGFVRWLYWPQRSTDDEGPNESAEERGSDESGA